MEKIKLESKLVSHSMAEAFNSCKRKFYYSHIEQLQSNKTSMGLARGNSGHAFFEDFFKSIQKGEDESVARMAGVNAWMNSGPGSTEVAVMNKCLHWVKEEWPKYDWEILAVEKEVRIEFDDYTLPMKIDLIVKDRSDGRILVIDHKFLYDPFSTKVMEVLPQLAKYVYTLRAKGLAVDNAYYNVVRTRPTKEQVFFLEGVEMTEAKLENVMEEQRVTAVEAQEGFYPIRTANKMNCDHCSFATLCAMELNGEPTKLFKKHNFEKNTYGYKEL